MALNICKKCKQKIRLIALTCPNCGKPKIQKDKIATYFITAAIVGYVAFMAYQLRKIENELSESSSEYISN